MHDLIPAILTILYHSFVGSSGRGSSASSWIGCGANFRQIQDDPRDKLLDAAIAGVDDVRRDHHVLVEKIRWLAIIGEVAADAGGRHEHRLRPVARDACLDLSLAGVSGGKR